VDGDLQKRFGANLRAVRRAKGMSQEEFAEHLGCHRTYVGGLERGERNVSLRTLDRLAGELGVDPISLLQDPSP
jgi:transcriptional regulator with XRE-family HTH domain